MKIEGLGSPETKQLRELNLKATCPAEMLFLTRFYKALLLNDTISIDLGNGEAMQFQSGATEAELEASTYEIITRKKENPEHE